ncbi:MAG: peptidylprolyl isomerase [Telmatospirillum sp.]|nr:peptidylprolyl isomerase [Telmatospirillum sp.]
MRRRSFLMGLAAASLPTSTFAAIPAMTSLDDVVVLQLREGQVVIRLHPEAAPRHVERIKTLVRQGFYDGMPFHRVVDGFMAQTGDSRFKGMRELPMPNVPAEFNATAFKRGVVGMARSRNPNSARSQFFIMLADGDFLNGRYTAFGSVVAGMEFMDKVRRGSPEDQGLVANPSSIVMMRVAGDMA